MFNKSHRSVVKEPERKTATKIEKWRYFLFILIGAAFSYKVLDGSQIDTVNQVVFSGVLAVIIGRLFNSRSFSAFGIGMVLCAMVISILVT